MAYLTGKAFEDELEKEDLGHEPLVEEFIYKNTVNMIYAKPGHGKSVVSANLAAESITRGMVFGYLPSKINRIAYYQTEGSRDEQLGRIQAMQQAYGKIDGSRISWHNTHLAIENTNSWTDFLKELDAVKPFELLIIDPIYSLSSEGVVTEKFCHYLRGFTDKIRAEFGASILMNHHTPKDMMNYKGDKIEKDFPMGMQWLEGNLDAMYFFKQLSKSESFLELKKNRPQSLIEKIGLEFDIANWTVKFIPEKSSVTARQKVRAFLNKKFTVNAFATTSEICRECHISRRHLRRMKTDGDFADICTFFGDEKKELTWSRKV